VPAPRPTFAGAACSATELTGAGRRSRLANRGSGKRSDRAQSARCAREAGEAGNMELNGALSNHLAKVVGHFEISRLTHYPCKK
jgi:hypothetical protein